MTERRLTAEERQLVLARACGCCEYCRSQERFSTQTLSIEHIQPRSQGGRTIPANLALACQGCNNHKYNKMRGIDPATGELVPLYHPRKHRWSDHFAWNEDRTLILGLTPTGLATIATLHLNREGVVNLRRALYALGKHPPPESTERH